MAPNHESQIQFPVAGFHGTTSKSADEILIDGFRLSRNPYDWLGDGVYFFQDGLERAWEWAIEHHGEEAVVIGAEILLVDCLDMLDPNWAKSMTLIYDQFLSKYKQAGLSLPSQTSGAHRLDREVINYAVGVMADQGTNISCVRGAFAEGHPVYPDSAFYHHAHIQIAVRDFERCIKRVWLARTHQEGNNNG
jgi:hypothetical protein